MRSDPSAGLLTQLSSSLAQSLCRDRRVESQGTVLSREDHAFANEFIAKDVCSCHLLQGIGSARESVLGREAYPQVHLGVAYIGADITRNPRKEHGRAEFVMEGLATYWAGPSLPIRASDGCQSSPFTTSRPFGARPKPDTCACGTPDGLHRSRGARRSPAFHEGLHSANFGSFAHFYLPYRRRPINGLAPAARGLVFEAAAINTVESLIQTTLDRL